MGPWFSELSGKKICSESRSQCPTFCLQVRFFQNDNISRNAEQSLIKINQNDIQMLIYMV